MLKNKRDAVQKEVLVFLPPKRPTVTNKKIENRKRAEWSSAPTGFCWAGSSASLTAGPLAGTLLWLLMASTFILGWCSCKEEGAAHSSFPRHFGSWYSCTAIHYFPEKHWTIICSWAAGGRGIAGSFPLACLLKGKWHSACCSLATCAVVVQLSPGCRGQTAQDGAGSQQQQSLQLPLLVAWQQPQSHLIFLFPTCSIPDLTPRAVEEAVKAS